jgi:hypothetical protein
VRLQPWVGHSVPSRETDAPAEGARFPSDTTCIPHPQETRSGLVSPTSPPESNSARQIGTFRFGQAAATLGINDLLALVRYILAEPNEVEAAVLREVLKEIIPGQETRVMSIAAEQWKAEAKAEGIQIGEISGKAKGIEAGKADLLLRQLRRRFGALPESTQTKVLCASEDQLNEWAETLLDASTLDAVFGAHRAN